MNRSIFSAGLSAALPASRGATAGKLTLRVRHTGLSGSRWAVRFRPAPAIIPWSIRSTWKRRSAAVAALGFYGLELFGNQIEAMEAQGRVGELLEKHHLPLISAYCNVNLSDPAARKDSIAQTLAWGNW